MVMAIIAMAVGVVIPRIGSSEVTFLKAQVREAVAKLRYTRRTALVEGKQKVATFNQNQKKEGEEGEEGEQGEIGEQGEVYKVTFYPEGGSSGGEIILTHLDYKAKITVNPITGKIESEILYE
ncbi:hypothetical protein PN36_30955 [Candidatus Thiomargarita nelsonii]|uniref:General secretion pathway protein H n=1 Tax=Candidatus Thiomargarita nelsonii TaxID=1003181 RepID=A0A0A6P6I9_9GAMM|nr:hypothetical protein PN36_30955 [Candidatus Thiomargarita nelsonii]